MVLAFFQIQLVTKKIADQKPAITAVISVAGPAFLLEGRPALRLYVTVDLPFFDYFHSNLSKFSFTTFDFLTTTF